MKTTADMSQILYDLLNNSPLKTAINGKIYKGERPINSAKEDAVILPVVISGEDAHIGVAFVNIYVPKKNQNIDGVKSTLIDSHRVSQLLPIATTALKYNSSTNFVAWIANQYEFDEPEINQTRLSFRVEFRLYL